MIPIDFFRQFRFGEYAIFDIALAFLGIYLLAPLLSKLFKKIGLDIPKLSWIYFTLPIGIISHILVGNITPMTRDFLDLSDHYILKIIIIILFVLGMKGIKKVNKKNEQNRKNKEIRSKRM